MMQVKSRLRFFILLGVVVLYCCASYMAMVLSVKINSTQVRVQSADDTAADTVQQSKRLRCFIITMDASLRAVRLANNVTCHPFMGERTTAYILSLVDAEVLANFQRGAWARGAHFTNNNSVSIAYNHMQIWRKLAQETDGSEDFLILEDDAIVTNQVVYVYDELQKSGLFRHNYIVKVANHYRSRWLGNYELASLDRFSARNTQYVLKKCVCKTRQNLFGAGAYVLDRRAARALLTEFFPMRTHVDTYLHYMGYKHSNLFVVENDVIQFSGRLSTHFSQEERVNRRPTEFKEQLMNFFSSDCTLFAPPSIHVPKVYEDDQ